MVITNSLWLRSILKCFAIEGKAADGKTLPTEAIEISKIKASNGSLLGCES